MLCVWSQHYGIRRIGVDISPVFLKAAHARAAELNCSDSLLLVGKPYWIDELYDDTVRAISGDNRAALHHLMAPASGSSLLELIEMILADHYGCDRYIASQWHTVSDWLRANPASGDPEKLREWIATGKREHLVLQRRYLGWGVFVARLI
jgi:hypothetical protein